MSLVSHTGAVSFPSCDIAQGGLCDSVFEMRVGEESRPPGV
jgi:hypothetical protein